MDALNIVFGVLLLIAALFLIVAVLMQNGKSHGLSGAIAGGAETFFGKQKGATIEKKLSKLTTIVAIVFVVIVVVVYVLQDQTDYDAMYKEYINAQTADVSGESDDTDAVDTSAEDTDVADDGDEAVSDTEAAE